MPKIYRNTEGTLTLPGGWTFTWESNTANDEYAGEENVLGLFAGGWCIIGLQIGRTKRDDIIQTWTIRPGRVGVILGNRFCGLWQDPDWRVYQPSQRDASR